MTGNLKKALLQNLPYLMFVYVFDKLSQAVRLAPGIDVSQKLLHLSQGFSEAFSSMAPSIHLLDLGIGIAGAVLVRLAVYAKAKNAKKYRRGMEYGSARWGTAADISPYVDPVPDWNIPLTQTEKLTISSRPKNPKHARNKNILVIGGSGSGKTRFFVKPSLMQMHSSYVVTDPKGQLLCEVGTMLRRGAPKLDENGKPMKDARGKVIYEPYRIKVLNTINFSKSMKYNPFAYIRSEKDILKLVNVIIANTKGDGEKSSEDFWVKAERLLYCALIGYIWYEAEPEEKNFITLLELINASEAREDDEEFQSPVDLLFAKLEKEHPDHFAVKQYRKFKLAAGKTLKSILVSCGARLAPFDIKELRDVMTEDELELDTLPVGERNIFLLICCKLLCAAAEPHVYETVTASFDCGGHTFTAKGRRVLSEGWQEIDRIFRSSLKNKPEDEDTGDGSALTFAEGQVFENVPVSVTEHFTSPPKPYTEDTLLAAMERAGAKDMPEDAERKGLGTPATRASIIEKLVSGGFVERRGKSLAPTKAGINLSAVLPEMLTSPMLTADWEQRLNQIAKGEASADTFMADISAMASQLVQTYSCISEEGQKLFAPEKEMIGACPRCGKPVYEGKKNFSCSDRGCQFVMWKNDRFWTSRHKELTKKMAADLLKKGRTSVKGMWSEKTGSTYDAVVILDDTGGKYVNFKMEFPKRKERVNGRR